MSIDADSPTDGLTDGLTTLLDGPDGLVLERAEDTPAWSSSGWTLAGLVVVGCLAMTALLGVVLPVVADLVLGWVPRFLQL